MLKCQINLKHACLRDVSINDISSQKVKKFMTTTITTTTTATHSLNVTKKYEKPIKMLIFNFKVDIKLTFKFIKIYPFIFYTT